MPTQGQVVIKFGELSDAAFQFPPKFWKSLKIALAFVPGWIIWFMPAPAVMGQRGLHFLATLSVGVTLWIFEVFDDYIVALMLLFSWVTLEIVPSKVALAGFSQSSWFFVIGVLGIGAAVNKTGLLYRLSLQCLSLMPHASFKTHRLFFLLSGLLATPLLPTGKARTAISLPVSQALSEATGFGARSNGSAALTLAALMGFSQMSFMFLTGGAFCLLGWNLLPEPFKSEFGWITWFLAALPAGIFIILFMVSYGDSGFFL